MSREHKYRIWHIEHKVMFAPEALWFNNPVKYQIWYNNSHDYPKGFRNKLYGYIGKDGILMQFTGIKDKNGMPVYEGDIVLNEDFVGNPDCVNKWEREVTWDDTNAAWAGIEGEVVTVLGNIHQHSHLLP